MNPENINQPAGGAPTSGTQAPANPAPAQPGSTKVIALVVLLLALLLGGYFLVQSMTKNPEPVDTIAPIVENSDTAAVTEAQAVDPNTVQGTSIDLSEIEKDLNATDLNTLSADLNAI